jgi:hypothetical protein
MCLRVRKRRRLFETVMIGTRDEKGVSWVFAFWDLGLGCFNDG